MSKMKVSTQPKHYIVPHSFLEGRQDLSKNAKRLLALAMIALQQERNKLYEDDPEGKVQVEGLPRKAQQMHYHNYMPSEEMIGRLPRVLKFDIYTLEQFFRTSGDSLRKTLKRTSESMVGRFISVSDKDTFTVMTPIPYAKYVAGSHLELSVTEQAIPQLFNHSRGYSSTELSLWCELESQHSQRLLEIISRHKERNNEKFEIDDIKRMLGVDYVVITNQEEAEESGQKVGDYRLRFNEKTHMMEKIPRYRAFRDFKRSVLDIAFGEIIQKSRGVWTPTDEKGVGYKLHRRGRAYSVIEICLQYQPDQTGNVPEKLVTPVEVSSVDPALAIIEELEAQIIAHLHTPVSKDEIDLYRKLAQRAGISIKPDIVQRIKMIESELGK
ncbi:replication initiation protein [Thaumasiovibrio subtropicus]|uniref:replication initiation protein n=1 Tax=Thaumasiovibrio subtropicus TaxID=1891207 RepID=UPI000B35461A|nr:replication initiation protein [Thaumasiovibrio subtropicus]